MNKQEILGTFNARFHEFGIQNGTTTITADESRQLFDQFTESAERVYDEARTNLLTALKAVLGEDYLKNGYSFHDRLTRFIKEQEEL